MDASTAETHAKMVDAVPAAFMCGKQTHTESVCVHELFERQVALTPDRVAVESHGQQLTYRQLNERANQLAHYLQCRGVGPNTLVGVSFERSLDLLVAIYGILKAGGAYVPLDPSYPLERLRYMVDAANVKHLVTHSSCQHLYSDLSGVDVLQVDAGRSELESQSTNNPEPTAKGEHLIYVIFTSGSTGQPKAAAVYHRGFTNLIQWFVDEFAINGDDHALLVSSLSFDLTQKNLYATLVSGGSLHLYPSGPYDLSELSRLIELHGITLMNCTPSAFYPLIEPFDDCKARSLASLRVVFLGGEPISVARITPWITHSLSRSEIANTYGPTECTDICGFYRLTRDNLTAYDFVPLGRPVYNAQMAIVNPALELCSIGESGELCVGGAGVGAGYINDAAMTAEKFIANPISQVTSDLLYRTGDQARWHASGVIEFLGRLDYQVKVRGFRIELPEIERAMETHEAVSEAIVVVLKDDNGGDPQLVGCYTQSHEQNVDATALRCHLTKCLPAHMVPSTFELYGKFPLSPNGKVDRHALAATVRQQSCVQEPLENSHAKTLDEFLQQTWCQLLNKARIGPDDNFFDVGGDSLQLARLHQLLETYLERKFPITDLFAHPTIQGMSKHLGSDSYGDDRQQQVRDRARMQREAMAARRRGRN